MKSQPANTTVIVPNIMQSHHGQGSRGSHLLISFINQPWWRLGWESARSTLSVSNQPGQRTEDDRGGMWLGPVSDDGPPLEQVGPESPSLVIWSVLMEKGVEAGAWWKCLGAEAGNWRQSFPLPIKENGFRKLNLYPCSCFLLINLPLSNL